ncbi:hypothetical protein FC34_GL000682 [Lacticaseibacillus brantae DSM 23927]|uniref:Uncharacterized protein n=1 Tax=Lacticaseibacillus brantae DSM 23927 TaxID=1423727 RepID=A0A0R2B0C6_9LACO|nr:hypothetical protein FC34_GL000682 [Lacticaseibacillus brantae DSM 23927]
MLVRAFKAVIFAGLLMLGRLSFGIAWFAFLALASLAYALIIVIYAFWIWRH